MCQPKMAKNIYQLDSKEHNINRKLEEIFRISSSTQQKTIYRVTSPLSLGMCKASKERIVSNSKVGRPRKRNTNSHSIITTTVNRMKRPSATVLKQITVPTVATPKLNNALNINESNLTCPALRTRLGRKERFLNSLSTISTSKALNHGVTITNPPVTDDKISEEVSNIVGSLVADLKDKDYYCKTSSGVNEPNIQSLPSTIQLQTQSNPSAHSEMSLNYTVDSQLGSRRIPPTAICRTCNKIFLGRRMERHYVKHPDHWIPNHQLDSVNSFEIPIFNFLVAKLKNSLHLSEEQRVDLFLSELNNFVEQLQVRSTRLIRNASGFHLVNARTARLLGIPEGQYALDMSAIESPHLPETEHAASLYDSSTISTVRTRNIVDYTSLSMSIDETFTDEAAQKLNLSAGGKLVPPSEESLLRAVDDLIQVRMNKLSEIAFLRPSNAIVPNSGSTTYNNNGTGSTENPLSETIENTNKESTVDVLPNYVHVSDNAVEADNMKQTSEGTILDLNADFFSI